MYAEDDCLCSCGECGSRVGGGRARTVPRVDAARDSDDPDDVDHDDGVRRAESVHSPPTELRRCLFMGVFVTKQEYMRGRIIFRISPHFGHLKV